MLVQTCIFFQLLLVVLSFFGIFALLAWKEVRDLEAKARKLQAILTKEEKKLIYVSSLVSQLTEEVSWAICEQNKRNSQPINIQKY